MEARVIGPKEFGRMLGVSDHTAAAHMRKHPRCINIGLGTKEYLRLPIEAAEEILTGIRPLSPIEDKPKAAIQPKKKARARKPQAPCYIPYR